MEDEGNMAYLQKFVHFHEVAVRHAHLIQFEEGLNFVANNRRCLNFEDIQSIYFAREHIQIVADYCRESVENVRHQLRYWRERFHFLTTVIVTVVGSGCVRLTVRKRSSRNDANGRLSTLGSVRTAALGYGSAGIGSRLCAETGGQRQVDGLDNDVRHDALEKQSFFLETIYHRLQLVRMSHRQTH